MKLCARFPLRLDYGDKPGISSHCAPIDPIYRHTIYQWKADYCSCRMMYFILWLDKKLEIYNSMNFQNDFSHFYFSNMNFWFTINSLCTKLFLVIGNIHMQGSMSQNFDLGFCYLFMIWNVKKTWDLQTSEFKRLYAVCDYTIVLYGFTCTIWLMVRSILSHGFICLMIYDLIEIDRCKHQPDSRDSKTGQFENIWCCLWIYYGFVWLYM